MNTTRTKRTCNRKTTSTDIDAPLGLGLETLLFLDEQEVSAFQATYAKKEKSWATHRQDAKRCKNGRHYGPRTFYTQVFQREVQTAVLGAVRDGAVGARNALLSDFDLVGTTLDAQPAATVLTLGLLYPSLTARFTADGLGEGHTFALPPQVSCVQFQPGVTTGGYSR